MDIRGIKEGDRVVTRKPHACGGKEWKVVRTGADFKLECRGCGRVVLLSSVKAAAAISKKLDEDEQ